MSSFLVISFFSACTKIFLFSRNVLIRTVMIDSILHSIQRIRRMFTGTFDAPRRINMIRIRANIGIAGIFIRLRFGIAMMVHYKQ